MAGSSGGGTRAASSNDWSGVVAEESPQPVTQAVQTLLNVAQLAQELHRVLSPHCHRARLQHGDGASELLDLLTGPVGHRTHVRMEEGGRSIWAHADPARLKTGPTVRWGTWRVASSLVDSEPARPRVRRQRSGFAGWVVGVVALAVVGTWATVNPWAAVPVVVLLLCWLVLRGWMAWEGRREL